MVEDPLPGLARRLADRPDDPETLLAVAVEHARTGRLPAGFTPRAVLGPLLGLWAKAPDERSLGSLILPAMGLAPHDDPGSPPAWWARRGRPRSLEGRRFDPATGFPLRVTRVRDGAAMVLVPGGPMVRGSDAPPRCGPPHRTRVSPYLIDAAPVPARAFARWWDAVGRGPARAPAGPWGTGAAPGDGPATALTWEEAGAYAAWVGGRLPTEAESEKAVRGPDGATWPWGEVPRPPGPGADGSPFGLTGLADRMGWWCTGAFHREGYRDLFAADPHLPGDPASERPVRRGSFPDGQGIPVPAYHREGGPGAVRKPDLGIRVVMSLSGTPDRAPEPDRTAATRVRRKGPSRPVDPLSDLVDLAGSLIGDLTRRRG